MMSPQKSLKVAIALSVAVVALFMMSSMAAPMSSGMQANNFTTEKGIQPFPTLNTNVTWSTFYRNYTNPMEYEINSTAKGILNAEPNTFYKNPITVNTGDIESSQLDASNARFLNTSEWSYGLGATNSLTLEKGSINKMDYSFSTLDKTISAGFLLYGIPEANLPYDNPAYNYITISGYTTQTGSVNGMSVIPYFGNFTTHQISSVSTKNGTVMQGTTYIYSNEQFFISANMPTLLKDSKYNNTGLNVLFGINDVNTTTAATFNLYITGITLSGEPLYVGTNANNNIIYGNIGKSLELQKFDPNFNWTSINDNGYTVAVSQPLQKATTQQNAISGINYIEQVEYQGSFGLPSAPDLSYGPATLTEELNISSSQVQVLDINGQSYLNSLTGKNGTVTLVSAANPTQTTSYLEIVDYTSSQWQSISGPPGFFSVAGIEYYFDELVLGIAAFMGLGATAAALKVRQLRRVR